MTVHLYHWEPNANSGKPMLTLAEKGVPFGCLRVISDSADQALDPKLAALLGGPRVSAWSVLKLLLRSPRLARELFRLARQTRHASRQLGLALGELLTRTEQPSQD